MSDNLRKSSRKRKAPASLLEETLSKEEEKHIRFALEKSKQETQAPTYLKPFSAKTFYPNPEEFQDPIQYIATIKREISNYGGIAKVVPPKEWKFPFAINPKVLEIPTKEQRINRLGEGIPYGTGKTYTYDKYKQIANKFREKWENVLTSRGQDPSNEFSWEVLYWRIIEGGEGDVVVEYGSDITTEKTGGGFPKHSRDIQVPQFYAETEWNPANIPFAKGSILRNLKDRINGINVPWLYFGMPFATFSWHVEDNWLYSLNYHHHGFPKVWYGISPDYQMAFGDTLKAIMPVRFDQEPNLLSNLVTMVNPSSLLNRGIRVHTIIQYPGEFIVTLPGAYHSGFSLGFK